MSGKLTVVGFGPGSKDDMTFRAAKAIEEAEIIVGYKTYTDIVAEFFPGKDYRSTGMMGEVERCQIALDLAKDGRNVVMVCSGDSGIYGMAGIVYELAYHNGSDVEISSVPGITAASSAAALLGAPLMHDTALISLSDWLTPIDLIMKRIDRAADSDMVIALYNPKSAHRPDYLKQAFEIISKYRGKGTPVGIVREIGRADQQVTMTTVGEIDFGKVDMLSTVIVGNSQTKIENGRMITPRGYKLE
jgi:precorrin-3B C17-methyltransferase